MDVRCDRCQTEYELDDETVAEGGASVQCTSCGHTFVVTRQQSAVTPTPPPVVLEAGLPGSWMLTTDEGKTHRFRDSTTLQKWVVERRVGRADRACPPGGSWRRLGDMDELRPFFDVVDQADRASAERGVRPTHPETPAQRGTAAPYASPDDDDDDVLTTGQQFVERGRAGPSGRDGSTQGGGGFQDRLDYRVGSDDDDEDLEALVAPRRTGPKVVMGILIVGLAGVAAYLGFNGFGSRREMDNKEGASTLGAAGSSAPVAPAGAANAGDGPKTPPPPTAAPAVVPGPGGVSASATGPATAAPAAADASAAGPTGPGQLATAPPAPAVAAPASVPVAAAPVAGASGAHATPESPSAGSGSTGADSPAENRQAPDSGRSPSSRARSYEQLVADGDRALQNGNTGKAQKLFDDALKIQPEGIAAMTGSGYLLLDRRKPLAAIGMFKRVLASAPSFPQALFGLGEAYRSQGDPNAAIEAYRSYLGTAPNGSDAPAARRQLRDLEDQAAPSQRSITSPSTPPAPPPPSSETPLTPTTPPPVN